MSTKSINQVRLVCFGVLLAMTDGCGPATAPSDTTQRQAAAEDQAAANVNSRIDHEIWDVYRIRGGRVGYGRTSIKHATVSGRDVVRIDGLNHLAIKRFGQTTEQDISFSSNETPDGQLIDFQSEIKQGPVPLKVSGRVAGERLEIKTVTQGKELSSSIPWKAEYGGFYASEMSLLRKPMKAGEKRSMRALAVAVYQVATIEMAAKDYETVKLLSGSVELLRIDTVTEFPGGTTLDGIAWIDRTGAILKTFIKALEIETFRVPKAVALEEFEAADLDLGWDISVRLERPIERPHEARQIRYLVRLDDGDPAAAFVSGDSQAVKSIDANTAELTVFAIRPGQDDGNPNAPDDPATTADREPNNLVQSDNTKIVAEAGKAAGDETDPWRVAVALEQYVHHEITEKNFSQAFATAADVAETREGDCSEHAVFLAALARARGLPARVAIGLVYMQGTQSFGYHAWNEVYIDDRWIPLDATLAKGGIGAGHLKLGHSSLDGASALSSFLPVAQVAGRLKIEKL